MVKLATPDARAATPTTVTFTEVGAHPFTVPVGVTSIHVVAIGAPGGKGAGGEGGHGAVATADLAVTPGQTLNVFVGGEGASTTPAPGGFNGGGDGKRGSGGGGGASDVRSGGPEAFSTRLVVAGGGGGGGSGQASSTGGDAGQPGTDIGSVCTGGAPATASEGGKGGKGGNLGKAGGAGALGLGGDAPESAGGGGGAGLFGGGAGGGYASAEAEFYYCGGGGGSSGFGPGTSNTSVVIAAFRVPSVTITYTGPEVPPTIPTSPVIPGSPGTGGSEGTGSPSTRATLTIPAVEHGEAVVAAVKIPANRSSLKADLLWQKSKERKPLVFGKLVEAGLKKGLHSFTVGLNGVGLQRLDKLGKLKLTLSVKVIPPQGAVATATKKVTLKP